ncbi:MAG: DUF1549 and DUF1553 domain-containing protein [Planctomycetota bacterium]|nr:DUF1549 and DUF1553 domain-containing protein [Planctomycetota bacterium]
MILHAFQSITTRKGLTTPFRFQFVFVAVLLIAPPLLRGDDALVEPPITAEDRDHWSFKPLSRPAIPLRGLSLRERNPIDNFIQEKLESKQLASEPPADRVTLIRRLYFNLLGLPPSPETVDSFVADNSPCAYERLVDRLLASHHYGEHWAQRWLDLARFAETDGFEHDNVRSDAWQYRDWVINALNADMPYDRFVSLQLAADEIAPDDKDQQIATSFCLSGPDMPDINSQEERRHNVLNELTSTVGGALLGLQVGCAQCHDHKYDPISQADFYRLRAIFEPAVHVKKNQSLSILSEKTDSVPVSHLMIRGDWQRPGREVSPDVPRIANSSPHEFAPVPSARTTGRRAAFARFLTDPDNPLTARVIANRIWQYHFGTGLSHTPSDFGTVGDEPTHPELLDWLATELMEQDWSLKQLHRLIVTSATYRKSSLSTDDARDPSNLWLARFPRQRLSGEVIRDTMFAASGTLDYAAQGPGVMPPLPDELVRTLLKNQWNTSERQADHYRRSIYLFARRNLRYPIFEAFDRPDANASCPRRGRSTTAPQSLLLLNSAFSLDAAQRLAGRVLATHNEVDEQAITTVFRRVLSRSPQYEDLKMLVEFVTQQAVRLQQESRSRDELALPLPCPTDIDPYAAAALTDLCLALFNSNEFIYID